MIETFLDILQFFVAKTLHIIALYYFYKFINCFIAIKEKKIFKIIAGIVLYFIVNVIIQNSDPINISFTAVAFLAVMFVCFDGKPIEKISIVMVIHPVIVALNFITYDFSYRIFRDLYKEKTFLFDIMTIFSFVLVSVFWPIVHKLLGKTVKSSCSLIDSKTWLLIDIICTAPVVSIFSSIISTPIGKEYLVYFISFSCIVTNLGVVVLIEYMVKSIRLKAENKNLKLEYDYYNELEHNQIEIRKLRHDMNNHLGVILSFIETENLNGAKEYHKSLTEHFRVSNREFCKNSILNAVINSKYNLAIKNNVDCFFNIDIGNLIPIADIDLCSIFSNTLDNAIEASQKIKDESKRKITVKVRCDKGYFSYSIANNIEENINFKNGKYITEKKDKKLHGYGITNITDIVKKYGGTISINNTDTEFNVIIAINIQ